nr:MAG TPA: Head Tail Connector Protein [Caudoviricetes sp.]
MKYLTHEEMQELATEMPVTFEIIAKLVAEAEKLVNIYTRRFYFYNNFNNENKFIKECIKDAIREQVRYFHSTNTYTLEEINDTPQTLTIGRMTISNSSKYGGSGNSGNSRPVVCLGFMDNLSATGRLWRGVD